MQLLMSEGVQAQVTQSRKSVTDSLSQQGTQLFQVSPYDQGTWLNNFENRFRQPQIPTSPYQQFPDIQNQIGDPTGQGTWLNNFENRLRQPQTPTNPYQQFPDIQKQINERIVEGNSLNNLAIQPTEVSSSTVTTLSRDSYRIRVKTCKMTFKAMERVDFKNIIF